MNPLDIIFRVKRQGNGAQLAKQEIEEVTQATRKQSEAQKDLNKNLGDGAAAAGGAAQIASGLRNLTTGNIPEGIASITSGIKALWATLIANPIGLVVAAISALIAVFFSWRKRVDEQKKAQEELNRQMQEDARQLAEYRAKVDIETAAIADAYKGVGDAVLQATKGDVWATYLQQLQAAADAAERLRLQTEAMADLDLAETMANIDLALATGEMDPADADRARAQARSDHGAARRAAAREQMATQEQIALDRQSLSRQNRDRTAEEAQQAGIILNRFRSRFHDAGFTRDPEIEQRELQKQIRGREAVAAQYGADPMDDEEYIALNRRLAVLQELMREGEREEELSQRKIEAAKAAAEAEKELAAAREALAATVRENAFGRTVLDRQEAIAGVSTQATATQIDNREREANEKAAAEAKAKADREAAEAKAKADREAAEAKAEAERLAAETVSRVADLPPVLPGTREFGDAPGLDSTAAVKRDNTAIAAAAQALNTYREKAASDNIITPEELEALYALIHEFVTLAGTMGTSQQNALRQVNALRSELDTLKSQFQNRP